MFPVSLKNPVTPRTAFNFSKASVVVESSRLTLPWVSSVRRELGSASTINLSPTAKAVSDLPRPNATVLGSCDGLVKLELTSPERLVSEGVVAECLPALLNHLPCVLAHQTFGSSVAIVIRS